MRLLPSTLAGRTLLLVFGAVLLAEGVTLGLGNYYRRSLFVSERAATIARYVRTLELALASLPPEAREAFLEANQRDGGVHILPRQEKEPLEQPGGRRALAEIATRLRAELGEQTPIRFMRRDGPPSLWVGIEAGGGKWWLVFSGARVEQPSLPWRLLATLAAIVGIVLGLSAAFVPGLTRPLRNLNEATTALGAGAPKPVTPAGPRELRELAEAFNQMLSKLEQSERERRVMLAGLPHDLRAPLARMKVRLAMLEDEQEQSGFRRDVEDIEHIAEQFVQYLRGLDGAAMRREPVELGALALERVSRYATLGKDVRFASGSGTVSGDRDALARALDNLIDNALGHGAPPVEIEVREAGGAVALAVRDHGRGIPEGERERMLEPFTQLDASRGTQGSVGLGLAIVQAIARAHGASVALASAPGGGLEARILFDRSATR